MSSLQTYRKKITSIQGTQKITKAMELVAASKKRKMEQRMLLTKPFANKIRQVIDHMAHGHSEYHHPALHQPEQMRRVGFIVVSTDGGLCGGLNLNLFKEVYYKLSEWKAQDVPSDLCLIGRKAMTFFHARHDSIIAHAGRLGDYPKVSDLIGIVRVLLNAFYQEEIDCIYLAYNEFVNTLIQRPKLIQLLPLAPVDQQATDDAYWDYIYEPGAKTLLDHLLTRYIESQVYQAVIENIACEQAARMMAMKNATDNAADIIRSLRRSYNKLRQASITQEISEIVAGADAIETQ